MARKARRSRRSAAKSAAPRGGKHVKIGSRQYNCHAKRVKKGFGHPGKTVRAYCRRVKKA